MASRSGWGRRGCSECRRGGGAHVDVGVGMSVDVGIVVGVVVGVDMNVGVVVSKYVDMYATSEPG